MVSDWHMEKNGSCTAFVALSWVPGIVISLSGVLSGISAIQGTAGPSDASTVAASAYG